LNKQIIHLFTDHNCSGTLKHWIFPDDI